MLEIGKRLLFAEEAQRWATFGWNTKYPSSLAGHVSSHALPACFAVASLPMAACPLTGLHTGTSSEKCDAVDKSCLHGVSAGLEGENGISAPVAQELNTNHWE